MYSPGNEWTVLGWPRPTQCHWNLVLFISYPIPSLVFHSSPAESREPPRHTKVFVTQHEYAFRKGARPHSRVCADSGFQAPSSQIHPAQAGSRRPSQTLSEHSVPTIRREKPASHITPHEGLPALCGWL